MKLYAPKYYKQFSCIADKCSHSCCIGWEIDVDSDTLKRYKKLKHYYAKNILESIEDGHFILGESERCPHLDENGLCNIISHLGKDYLCNICSEHPRYYNDTPRGKEVGIGMACEEACRLILSCDDCFETEEISETKDEDNSSLFDTLPQRNYIFEILKSDTPHDEKLEKIYQEFSVSPDILTDEEWQEEIISKLEYLNESHKELFMYYSSRLDTPEQYEDVLKRALAYLIYRHCAECFDENDFISSLGFCLFCERLLCSILKKEMPKTEKGIIRWCVTLSEEIEYSEDNTDTIKFEFE